MEREYATTASAGYNRIQGPLAETLDRIESVTNSVVGVASNLRVHADELHGAAPEDAGKIAPQPVPSGMLDKISMAVTQLEIEVANLAHQAGRNSNLV